MKMTPYLIVAGIVLLTSCDTPIDPDINTLRSVAADKSQPDYIRKSVKFFDDFFDGKTVVDSDFDLARAELSATRTSATLDALMAILHSLEKRLPEHLPKKNELMDFSKRFKNLKEDEIRYKIEPAAIFGYLRNIIPSITYYDEKRADSEIDAFFSRLESKYGTTQAGQYWLGEFRMELNQAREDRQGHNGKWKSGRKQMGLEH